MAEQHNYEVEVRSLLGSDVQANKVRGDLYRMDPETRLISHTVQLNHYFIGGDLPALVESVAPQCVSEERCRHFELLAKDLKKVSVRSRQKNTGVFLSVKASAENPPAEHGSPRIELDEKVAIPLDALDALILGSGFEYQAKWSREREDYRSRELSVCLDKNAGYGWTATFTKTAHSQVEIEPTRKEIREFMKELGVTELSTERLERILDYYRAHWQDFYGTEKVFIME